MLATGATSLRDTAQTAWQMKLAGASGRTHCFGLTFTVDCESTPALGASLGSRRRTVINNLMGRQSLPTVGQWHRPVNQKQSSRDGSMVIWAARLCIFVSLKTRMNQHTVVTLILALRVGSSPGPAEQAKGPRSAFPLPCVSLARLAAVIAACRTRRARMGFFRSSQAWSQSLAHVRTSLEHCQWHRCACSVITVLDWGGPHLFHNAFYRNCLDQHSLACWHLAFLLPRNSSVSQLRRLPRRQKRELLATTASARWRNLVSWIWCCRPANVGVEPNLFQGGLMGTDGCCIPSSFLATLSIDWGAQPGVMTDGANLCHAQLRGTPQDLCVSPGHLVFLGHSSSDAQCLVYCTPQPALVRAASCCQPTLMMVTIKLSRGNHWTSRGDSDWTFKNTWIIDRAWSGLLLAACAQHDIHRRSTAEVGRIPRPFDNDFSERMRNELIRIQMEHRRQLLLLAWKIPFELVLSSPSKFRAQNVQCHSARNTVSSVSVSCVLQDLCFALCVHALMLREAYGRSRCVCIIIKVCTLWSSTVDMNFRACPSRVAVPCNGYSTPHSHSRGRSQFVCRLSLRHVFFEDLAVLQTVISRQHNRSHRAACQ